MKTQPVETASAATREPMKTSKATRAACGSTPTRTLEPLASRATDACKRLAVSLQATIALARLPRASESQAVHMPALPLTRIRRAFDATTTSELRWAVVAKDLLDSLTNAERLVYRTYLGT